MFSSKISAWIGFILISLITIFLYWEFYFFGKIPMPGDTIIGAYFPWLDYKWGYPVGVPVKNALISDVFSQFFLWKYLSVDIFKSGQIPLWNIYSLSGTPLLATYHSAVFNPFNLLLFLPKYYGWGFYISLQTFFALLGMFYLIGNYVKSFWPRIFGAIVFSLSGLMTTWIEFGTGVWAAAMLPWIFLFLENYLNLEKLRYLFLMSLSFIILYLSGHAQLTLYSTVLVLIYLLFKFFRKKNKLKMVFPGIFIILAIVFCSFQFLPTFEFTKESIRANEAYSSSFNYGLNPIYEIVKFFAADFFGNPTTNNYWDTQSYHEQSVFLGTLPFILIVTFLIYSIKVRNFNFWIGVFLITIILGFDNPLTRLLYSLPLPFLTYSSAARIFFITSFSAGILAAMAFEKLREEDFEKLFIKSTYYFLGCLIGIILGFFLAILFLKGNQFPEVLKQIENFKVTVKNLVIPLGVTLAILVALIIIKFKPKFKKIIITLFIVITLIDLSRYFFKYNPFISQDLVFPETPVIEFLQNQQGLFRIARLDPEILTPNTWTQYKLESVEGYDPLISENYARLFNVVKAEDYGSTLSRYREIDNFNPKFLDALNVKYLLSVKRDENNSVKGNILDPKIKENSFEVVFEDKNSVVVQNPNSLERVYFVSKVSSVAEKNILVDRISLADFDPKKEALILDQINIPEVSGDGQVEIINYSPNRIEFNTQTKNDEFLVFADTFNKGWKLLRNGNPEKIFETNLNLRGVYVPSGENVFVMEYFPDSFKYGLWLSGVSLVGYLVILLYSLRKKNI